MTIVRFDAVTFHYPGDHPRADSPALAGATFDIEEGSFVLVTGSTGSGKSTLLRCINGLVPHFTGGRFEGRVEVAGRDTLDTPPRTLAEHVAFVPQDPGASFVLDRVEDELAYAMENLGRSPAVMRRRVEEALDLLDLEPLRARSVRTLSGGERQRVAIAAALTAGARILVLDEPTSQLDPQGAEDVLAALQRLVHDLGLTVVVAEHRLERVAGFVDAAIGLIPGAPPVPGEPAEVFEWLASGPPVARLGRLVGWRPSPLTVRDARRLARGLSLPEPVDSPAGPAGQVLAARGLAAGYGRRRVLSGVSFGVGRGEIVALLGRNGAGKTTLLRCLAGLHGPDAGEVIYEGASVRTGVDVALVPQEPETVLFKDSVIEEVAATKGPESPAEVLARFGLGSLASRHPRDLSAGQRLLVAIAAVAATGAPVLLLDEPTRGLDPEAKLGLVKLLRAFAAEDGVVVMATHDVELAAEVAGRCVMLAAGEVIAEGNAAEVLGDSAVFAPQMTRLFGPGWLTVAQVAEVAVT